MTYSLIEQIYLRILQMRDPQIRGRENLRPYQLDTVDLIKLVWSEDAKERIPGIILAYDMGSGKTVSTLTALSDLIADGRVKHPLIVAPLLVAETVWPDEIELWRHTKHLSYSVITGTLAQRKTAMRKMADVHIINKENIRWLWKEHGRGETWPYDCLVIDEASMLKNGKKRVGKSEEYTVMTRRGERVKKRPNLSRFGVLANVRSKATGVIELTGTPTPKGLQNLWGLSYIADGGDRLGTSRTRFEKEFFDYDHRKFSLTIREGSFDAIMDKLKDIMFALPPDAYLGLPSIVPVVRKVKLPKPMLEEYKRFKRTLVTEMYDVEAVNSAVLVNKLLQFANGSLYQEEGIGVHVHDLKLKVLEELVEELDGQPLLVAYSFKFDLERIKKKFKKAVVLNECDDVRATVKKWNAGQIEMLVAHPLSAAHGLNLQHGGNQACWYGLNGDLELYQQFNKRLARSGQKEDLVFLHHIVAEGTHDERILPILADRAATQDDVLRAVQIELSNK